MKNFGDFVQKKYPNFTIEILTGTSPQNFIAEGRKIDLVEVQRASIQRLMLDWNLQSDISDQIKKFKYDLNQIEPAILNEMKSIGDGAVKTGAILGLPYTTNREAFIFNKELFDSFGVPYPKSGMVWEDLISLSNRMARTSGGVNYQGFIFSPRHYHLMNQLSQGYINLQTGKADFTNNNWQTIFRTFSAFFENPANPYTHTAGNFEGGKVAMQIRMFVPTNASMLKIPFQWDFAEIPSFSQYPGVSTGMLSYYFNVASTSQNRDQAFLFAEALASKEVQLARARLGFAPALKANEEIKQAFGKDVPQYADKNVKAYLSDRLAAPAPFHTNQGLVDTVIDKAFDEVANNVKDINSALRDAEDAANKLIMEGVAKGK